MEINEMTCRIPFSKAETLWKKYSFGLIYKISEMDFFSCETVEALDFNECLEAYFFGLEGQLHLYRGEDGELCAVRMEEADVPEKEVVMIDRKYYLSNRWSKEFGNKVVIREYLEPDEDGQMQISYKRLLTVE